MQNGRCLAIGLLLVCSVSWLAGCAVSQPTVTPLIPQSGSSSVSAQSSPISATLYARHLYNGKISDSFLPTRTFNRQVRKAFEEQVHRFKFVEPASHTINSFNVITEATHSTDIDTLQGCLWASSLFIIPYRTKYALVLEGRLYQGDQLLKSYEVRGEYSVVNQLFLLNPFRWGMGAGKRMAEQAFATLFTQVEEDAMKALQ